MTTTRDGATRHLPTAPPATVPPPRATSRSTSPPGAPPPRRSLVTKLVAGTVALGAAVGVASAMESMGIATPENRFQTVSYAGENPFTAPVGADQPGLAPIAAGGPRRADTPEMYAQDSRRLACDGAALTGQLQADPAKAATWARIQRITPEELPAYVASLTPVVLRAHTAVVDHGYADGAFVATPAVLAAGTAVFVNSYGQPTVKCFSGDPLTPGRSADPEVTTVVASASPIPTHTFHHPGTGRPVACPGKPDTTGHGPVPTTDDDHDGSDAGDGPYPGNPGTPGPVTPPVTGTFNDDGSITLSDGRIQTTSGAIITLPAPPPGSTPLPDGGYRNASGAIVNRDGSPRPILDVEGPDRMLLVVMPDGTVINRDRPGVLPAGLVVKRGYDGSVTVVIPDARRGVDTVQVISGAGRRGPVLTGRYEHGVVIDAGGRVLNPNGTERTETTIPGGGKVRPDGTNVPAPGTGTTDPTGTPNSRGEPKDGVDHPRSPVTDSPRIDPPFRPRPHRESGGPQVDPADGSRSHGSSRDSGSGDGGSSGHGGTSGGGH